MNECNVIVVPKFVAQFYRANDGSDPKQTLEPLCHWFPLRSMSKTGSAKEARSIAEQRGWTLGQVTTFDSYKQSSH